jgi:hypothetical protein
MRIALALPLLLLGACQVSKGENEVSVTYNEDVAANAAADVGNTLENVAGDIGNDVKTEGAKVQNKLGDTDVNVTVNRDVKTENTVNTQ